MSFEFYPALHQPYDAQHFERCLISISRLRNRRSGFASGKVIVDSKGYTELTQFGYYRDSVPVYAEQIRKIKGWLGERLVAVVSQDYMCESEVLAKTGLTVREHQRLSVERYDELLAENTGAYIMPVLQGYKPQEYVDHIRQYGQRLAYGAWVGVGSVCKRNANVRAIEQVLRTIRRERPDLKLHGFGLKKTALKSPVITEMLGSADSMAWSYSARKQGRNANDWREADAFRKGIEQFIQRFPEQIPLFLARALEMLRARVARGRAPLRQMWQGTLV